MEFPLSCIFQYSGLMVCLYLSLPGMCAAEIHMLFSSEGNIISSFTFYTTHIINVSNGCYIITHNSDMQKVFVFTVSINTYLYCFEFQNINMVKFCLMPETSRWGYSIGNSPTCKTSICMYGNVRNRDAVNMVALNCQCC